MSRSGNCLRQTLKICKISRCRQALLVGLAICCLLYLVLQSTSSSKSLQLQHRNASLAQAASLSRQLRELTLGHFSHQKLSSAFKVASQTLQVTSHPEQLASGSYDRTAEFELLVTKALNILSGLSSSKPVAVCTWDATMPINIYKNKMVLLAANMNNNEDLLPHFTLQLLHLLASIPLGNAFLSIYESGSTDGTGTDKTAARNVTHCSQLL